MSILGFHSVLRLLVVEDNEGDLYWLKLIVEEAGLLTEIQEASNGEEALRLLQSPDCRVPDLLFLDLNIPRLEGMEVLHTLKSDEKLSRLPVCVVTGSLMERERISHLFGIDIRCYVRKPISLNALIDALDSYEPLQPTARELRNRLGDPSAS